RRPGASHVADGAVPAAVPAQGVPRTGTRPLAGVAATPGGGRGPCTARTGAGGPLRLAFAVAGELPIRPGRRGATASRSGRRRTGGGGGAGAARPGLGGALHR